MSLNGRRRGTRRARRDGRWLALPAVLGALAVLGGACGARTGLDIPPPAPIGPECVADNDCPGFGDMCNPVRCRILDDGGAPRPEAGSAIVVGRCETTEAVDCDDHDPCTNDVCEPTNGQCHYSLAALDLDHDGHKGPRPGTKPGAPDSCGDDCDDSSAAAFPGNPEVCDGVDNDCNGIVDDNATFVPLNGEVRVSGDIAPAGPGGIAWSGKSYASVYSGTTDGFDMYLSMLDPTGNKLPPGEQLLTLKNADGAGGPVLWVGDRYGVAWQDRRDTDYEVYFTILKENGAKAIPDTRLSFATGFSINVALAWTGAEFIPVWQDERDGIFNLIAQRISLDGAPIGDNVALTNEMSSLGNEAPSVASGFQGIGVAWTLGDAFTHIIQFQTFSRELEPISAPVTLTDGTTEAVYPSVVWNKDRYIVAWFDRSASPKAIYAAAVAEDGSLLVSPTAVSSPGPFRSRYPFLRALGDRVLVLYADDRDQNNGYELYSHMIDSNLASIGPEQRLTNAQRDSIYPVASFGPDGDLGILFRDDRENGEHHVYFTRLGCVTANP